MSDFRKSTLVNLAEVREKIRLEKEARIKRWRWIRYGIYLALIFCGAFWSLVIFGTATFLGE